LLHPEKSKRPRIEREKGGFKAESAGILLRRRESSRLGQPRSKLRLEVPIRHPFQNQPERTGRRGGKAELKAKGEKNGWSKQSPDRKCEQQAIALFHCGQTAV
jgi:hypothetical protein